MRWILGLVSGLIMLGLLAVGLVFLIPSQEIARRAAEEVRAMTGRELQIEGPVKVSVWPRVAVSTGPVRFANADWATGGPMITAAGLDIALDTRALLGRQVAVTGLTLNMPQILLERAADGRVNWDLDQPGTAAATPGTGQGGGGFTLAEARVIDGAIRYLDQGSGMRHQMTGVDAVLRMPDLARAAELTLSGHANGQAMSLTLSASPAAAMLSGAEVQADLSARIGGSAIDFEGVLAASPLKADGALHLDASDRPALSAVLQMPLPSLPHGFGARRLVLDGRAVVTSDMRLALRDAVVQLDDSRMRITADLSTQGARPRLEASITAETPVVLPDGPGGTGGGGGTARAGWSDAPIDLSALRTADADVTFAAPGLSAAGLRLGALRARLQLDNGRAEIALTEMAAYEGRITGTVVVNSRGAGSARADLTLQNVATAPLLLDLAGNDRLIAQVNGSLSLLAPARSVQAMMSGLEGKGQFALGTGELRGLDLVGMLRNLDPGFVGEGQKTIFDGISGSFTVANGVLTSQDLKLAAPLLRADGQGTVDIGQQRLNWKIVPVALERTDGTGGLSVPLQITGPWSDLSYRLDLEALAKPKLDAERRRAEERAKEELARKLGQRTEEGESLEDAAKRKLEKEVMRGLGKFLGGN